MFRLMHSPEDSGSGSGSSESVEDILLDNDDESLEDDKSQGKGLVLDEVIGDSEKDSGKEKEDEDDEDELKALEEDLAEPDPSKLEADANLPKRRDILKKYPNFFKDFPGVEKSYYREQKFTQIFPNPADAQEGYEKAQALDNFEQDLLGGRTENLFKSVKDSDQNAFHNLVDNLLENLGKVDEQAQLHVIRNVAKNIIAGMLNESQTSENEALKHAALILNQFAFGTSQYEPPTRLARSQEKSPESEQFNNERNQFQRQRYETSRGELIQRVDSVVIKTIEKNIDPNDSMSDFVKNAAITKAKSKVNELIGKDDRFKSVLTKLWTRAASSNYGKSEMDAIHDAYTNRAKLLLPTVLKSVRLEALKGLQRKVKQVVDDDDDDKVVTKKPSTDTRKSASSNSGTKDKKNGIPEGVSIRSYIESDEYS